MSQLNPGDWPIIAGETTGDELADILNRFSDAVRSGFLGANRPASARRGMSWVQQLEDGTLQLWLYDGTEDRLLLTVAPDGGVTLANSYTRGDVDQKIAALQAQVDGYEGVPTGTIVMWSGAISAIPAGWRLCNGTGGTPNLRDRFIVGAGGEYAVGTTGGVKTQTDVPSHAHVVDFNSGAGGGHNHDGLTRWAGQHDHRVYYKMKTSLENAKGADGPEGPPGGNDYYATYYGTATRSNWPKTEAAGSHRHEIAWEPGHEHQIKGNTRYFGVAGVDNRPPFYALCYIMKL